MFIWSPAALGPIRFPPAAFSNPVFTVLLVVCNKHAGDDEPMNQADAIGSLQDVLEGELTLRGGLPGKHCTCM